MKLVILDRDGVINQDSAKFIKRPEEWIPIDGSLEAIARLNQHGFDIAIATNQSGIGRGLFDMSMLNRIHDKMHHATLEAGGRINAIFYCPHIAEDACSCRKPKPGMIESIRERFSTSLDQVPGVGDSLRDLQAFAAAGCQPILVKTGKGQETLNAAENNPEEALPQNTWICEDLAQAAQLILNEFN